MPELSIATIPLLLAFIVPGFVWWRVHQYLQISRPTQRAAWMELFTMSSVNYAIWSWWLPTLWVTTAAAIRSDFSDAPSVVGRDHVELPVAGWVIITLFSPVGLGLVTGFAQRTGKWRRFLVGSLRLNVPHPVETGWEYVFGRGEWLWATITLTDGSVVEGIFGDDSLASTRAGERDIYLQKYYPSESGRPMPVENDAGIWVAAPMIKAISFRNLQPPRKDSLDDQQ